MYSLLSLSEWQPVCRTTRVLRHAANDIRTYFAGSALCTIDFSHPVNTSTSLYHPISTHIYLYQRLRYEAMDVRPSYRGIKSDYYSHCHDLPPQGTSHFTCVFSLLPFDNNNSSFYLKSLSVGKCYFSPEAAPFTAEIDGGAWSVTKVGHNILADSHSFFHILFHPLHRSVTKVHL